MRREISITKYLINYLNVFMQIHIIHITFYFIETLGSLIIILLPKRKYFFFDFNNTYENRSSKMFQ